MQRELERQGIATVGLSLLHKITERVKPPRTYCLRYPFGHALGEAGNRDQQRQIVLDALSLLETVTVPGAIVESPYRWRRTRFAPEDSSRRT